MPVARAPRFPKLIRFGLGFCAPVIWKDKIPGRTAQFDPNTNTIEMSREPPLWEQYESYAHEVLHTACEFNLYVLREIVRPLQEEALRAEAELEALEDATED